MAAQERITKCVLVGGILVWIANGVIRWWLGAPLGHDEARYALDAREWLAGEPSRFIYSGVGMQLVAAPGILLGESERALRFVPLLLGTGFLGAAYLLARRACGPPTAAWTVAVLAGSPKLAIHGAELLSDLPAAACLLCACAILVADDARLRRMLLVAPLFAAAFYLRFGSVVPIAAVVGAFVLVYPSRIGGWAGALALFAALLVPHAVHSVELLGSPLAVLHASGEIPPPSAGFTQYLRDPLKTYGVLIAPLMFIAIAAAPRGRAIVALQLAAVGQFVLMTLISHAQPRFVYLATAILVLVGVDALWRLVEHLGQRARVIAAVVALGAIAATWTLTFVRIPRHQAAREAAGCASTTRIEWYGAACARNR